MLAESVLTKAISRYSLLSSKREFLSVVIGILHKKSFSRFYIHSVWERESAYINNAIEPEQDHYSSSRVAVPHSHHSRLGIVLSYLRSLCLPLTMALKPGSTRSNDLW